MSEENKALEAAIRVKAVLENGNDFPNTDDCMLVARFAIKAAEALEKIAKMKSEPILDSGFSTGPALLFDNCRRIARSALKGD